ncbi:DUF3310 domain-containing protein [Nocardia arthritidis]
MPKITETSRMDGLIRSKGKTTVSDAINPSHYQRHGAQLIDLIEHLPGNRFNAAKYVVRAGEKSPDTLIEDLDKGCGISSRAVSP